MREYSPTSTRSNFWWKEKEVQKGSPGGGGTYHVPWPLPRMYDVHASFAGARTHQSSTLVPTNGSLQQGTGHRQAGAHVDRIHSISLLVPKLNLSGTSF